MYIWANIYIYDLIIISVSFIEAGWVKFVELDPKLSVKCIKTLYMGGIYISSISFC